MSAIPQALKWVGAGLALLLVATVAVFWTPDTDAAAMRVKYGGPPSQFVELSNGLTVHLRDEGPRGAPVLMLLHGSSADLHTWDAWTRVLATEYRVVRFDQVGHGLTGPSPRRDYTMAAFVDTVERVRARLGIERMILGGNSMGGNVAWNYALAYPARLTGLVLVDAGGAPVARKASDEPIGFRIIRMPLVRDVALHLTPRFLVERSLRQTVANQAVVTPPVVDRYWELLRYPGNRRATLDRFALGFNRPDPQAVAAIKVPTLILWGEADRLLPVSGARWFAARIRGSRVITYPDVGHIPMEEAATRSATDLRLWLAALTRTPRRSGP